jgi:hypothetical protein
MQNADLGSLAVTLCHLPAYSYFNQLIKVVPGQSGKVEYERERLLGIAKNLLIC